MRKTSINIILDIIIIASVIYSMIVSYTTESTLTGGNFHDLLYFTYQSNIWIAVIALLEIISPQFRAQDTLSKRLTKLVFTSSIALTGIVYCFILSPYDGFRAEMDCICLHVIVPLCAVISWVVTSRELTIPYKTALWSLVPPLYYFGFATFGYLQDWYFKEGCTYPYFFLDWGKSAWWVPMWFVIVGSLLCGISAALIWTNNKQSSH